MSSTQDFDQKLKEIEEEIEKAGREQGDFEVREALMTKAKHFFVHGKRDLALSTLEEVMTKTVGVGARLETILYQLQVVYHFSPVELPKAKAFIEMGQVELEKGGDWERRNKLKVCEGIYYLLCRDFKQSAALFISCLKTFTATEFLTNKQYTFYTLLSAAAACDRDTLKNSVLASPEILQVVGNPEDNEGMQTLFRWLQSYYSCDYKGYYRSLPAIMQMIQEDRLLSLHLRYITCRLCENAYRQYLTPYRSVTLDAMAEAFGVTPDFIDREVSGFTARGKLTCKIDKVANVIEAKTDNPRVQAYNDILKEGDHVIRQVEKLSKLIDI
jgi:26S proteasome regulatory subunit N7